MGRHPQRHRITDPGDLAARFIDNLTHTGDFSGEPFSLRKWQKSIVQSLFGTLKPDGTRRYRQLFLALPRKQGKTELAAAMLLYLLLGIGRKGQQIYSASGDRAQASLIFRAAATMVRNDPTLSKICLVYDGYKRIVCEPLDSFYEALSSDAPRKHGLGPAAVLFDEVHVLPNRELHDVLTTGFGARREPLTIYITTAGWDRNSLCWDLWQHAERVRDGVIQDPTLLPAIYAAPPEADWTDPKVWKAAMPALGDFCSLEFIRDECKKAQNLPGYENTFRQLYLNQWTEQAVRWLAMDRWDACKSPIDEADLAGRECWGGLDLSQTRDLSAFAAVFPTHDGTLDTLVRCWAPEGGRWKQEGRTAELYRRWAREGKLILTPGESIDYDFIEAEIARIAADHDLRTLFADRAFANQLCTRLRDVHGINVAFLPQTPMALNAPTLELERLVLTREIRHDHPVLTWCASNVALRTNATALVMPDKAKSSGRIDALAALVNALAAYHAEDQETSVYSADRGLMSL